MTLKPGDRVLYLLGSGARRNTTEVPAVVSCVGPKRVTVRIKGDAYPRMVNAKSLKREKK